MTRRVLAVSLMLAILALGALTLRPSSQAGVHVEDAAAPDPGDRPLDLRIWYPAGPRPRTKLPLVVFSHGTGGGKAGHGDTAMALARSGFVVVAMSHTGDNYRDTGGVGRGAHLTGRPRHVSRTIDYMLGWWPRRGLIDPDRIGMFGHSAGGFTALVVAGAEPDLSKGAAFCRARPTAWSCRYLRRNGFDPDRLARQRDLDWPHDKRVKAAVIAAPAIGYSLDRTALTGVRVPLQIWQAEHDLIIDDSPDVIRQGLPVRPESHRIGNAGHFSFLEPCTLQMRALIGVMQLFGTEAICSDPEGFDRTRFHRRFNQAVTTFLKTNLPSRP